jgi:hypothetical protein
MKPKTETRKQLMSRIDKLMLARMPGHVVCRTCGVKGCCILDHDNLREVKP